MIEKKQKGRPKKDNEDKAKNMLISLPIHLYLKVKYHELKNSHLVQRALLEYFKNY